MRNLQGGKAILITTKLWLTSNVNLFCTRSLLPKVETRNEMFTLTQICISSSNYSSTIVFQMSIQRQRKFLYFLNIGIPCFVFVFFVSFFTLYRYYVFYKLSVCGNPASSKSISIFFNIFFTNIQQFFSQQIFFTNISDIYESEVTV